MGKRGKDGASLPLRLFSLLLSAVLVASSFPVEALAETLSEPEETVAVEPAADEGDEVVVEGEVEEPIVQEDGEGVSELVDIPEATVPEDEGEAETTVGPEEEIELDAPSDPANDEPSPLGETTPDDAPLCNTNAAATAAINALKTQSGFTNGSSYGDSGCWRFVNAACQRLYGEGAPGGTSGYQLTNPGNYPLVGRTTAPTKASVKNLLMQGYPGDIVQLKGGPNGFVSYQHTFILEAVSDTGITIWEHLDSTGVRTATYSWDDFYSRYGNFSSSNSSHGVSLYHHNRYASIFGNTNSDPIGYFDGCAGGVGTITVGGWAFDPDSPSKSIDVHFYVGKPSTYGELHVVPTWQTRSDVNASYGITGNHGFEITFETEWVGSVTVYMYAINDKTGNNPLIGQKTVTVMPKSAPAGTTTSVAEGLYAIRFRGKPTSGLDVDGLSTANNANVMLYEWTGNDNQKFNLVRSDNGTYNIIALHSNKAVEVAGAATNSAANISQYTQNGAPCQKWYIKEYSDSTYAFINYYSGLCLDVEGANPANSTNIRQWPSNDMDAQRFYLVPIDVSKWSVSVANTTYTGTARKPAPTVIAGGLTLTQGQDYTVSYKNNVNTGTASLTITGINGFTGSKTVTFKISRNVSYVPIYRMYNTKTSEHLWTKSKKEYDACGSGSYKDWRQEGIAWNSPSMPTPASYSASTQGDYVYVYRLYDKGRTGDHVYLTYGTEMQSYLRKGWVVDKGAGFWSVAKGYSDTGRTVIPIYRQYNSRLNRGKHHYTPSKVEYDKNIAKNGWTGEGVKFYVVKR